MLTKYETFSIIFSKRFILNQINYLKINDSQLSKQLITGNKQTNNKKLQFSHTLLTFIN